MKRVLRTLCLTLLVVGMTSMVMPLSLFAEELSKDRQREIIQNYMIVARQMEPSQAQSIGGEEPCLSCECGHCKCGTPHILEFMRNYDKLDRGLLQSMGAQLATRPVLGYQYDSPGGWVKIHYEKNGSGACWQPNVDTDGDGHPDYIEELGACGDSVFNTYLNVLGYPRPLFDTLAPGGGDARIDVYLIPLPGGYYGQTWGQGGEDQSQTAWVEIDHDFQHLPEYVGRPLDAARVTMAHELFHTIHFAIDVDESPAWREMSAVFMEEYMYDEVDDYLLYGPFFFGYPERSLQSEVAAHNYASVLFPLYLEQTYGVDIIRDIWLRCGELGQGDSFLPAADASIDSTSAGASNFHAALAEWAVWNFFTGPYADQAPDGIGYDEAEDMGFFTMDKFDVVREYPILVQDADNVNPPQFNGVQYIRLENLQAIQSHLYYYWYMFGEAIDGRWGLSAVYQLEDHPDSHFVETIVVDTLGDGARFVDDLVGVDTGAGPEIDVSRYRSITLVATPSTTNPNFYLSNTTGRVDLAYSLRDTSVVDPAAMNLPTAVLSPYPNPAVVSELDDEGVTFRFQVGTDETTTPIRQSAFLLVDLYTVAGERVKTVEGQFAGDDRTGEHRTGIFEANWDMRNEGGDEVASGVYLAYARLYEGPYKRELLAEDHVKVALIR